MKIVKRVLLFLALLHLYFVALGAFNVTGLYDLKWVGRPLEVWGNLTGAGDNYGFFAPGVFGQSRILFEILDEKGRSRVVPFRSFENHDSDLRVGDIVNQLNFFTDDGPSETHRELAKSLAATMFGKFPDARKVIVHLQTLYPVTMQDYRDGARQKWQPFYDASFERKEAAL
jgi:hypothetical protein